MKPSRRIDTVPSWKAVKKTVIGAIRGSWQGGEAREAFTMLARDVIAKRARKVLARVKPGDRETFRKHRGTLAFLSVASMMRVVNDLVGPAGGMPAITAGKMAAWSGLPEYGIRDVYCRIAGSRRKKERGMSGT